jgi:hypothetical protein
MAMRAFCPRFGFPALSYKRKMGRYLVGWLVGWSLSWEIDDGWMDG